jgi:hypothetical protein
MAFYEKTLTCIDCGKTFVFTVEEQEFFASKGYTNEPKRCPPAAEKKVERFAIMVPIYRDGPRQLYPAVCALCVK